MLSGDEKETTITMYGQDKEFEIFSAKPTIIKSLLDHKHFDLLWARVIGDDKKHRVKDREKLLEMDGQIVALEGRMPIGVLTVKSKPRANNHQSSIVSSETIDSSVFE
ncbi:hypothetical protein [Haloarcula sp. H-GB4]|uniref:hypothetical protein n=1 Tax=Haloarcula sp. H-GB4 TaxID=3069755 RepID=UPI0027D25581|nr:hypothetical protein [Haloarcula sp. H-GB4]